MRKSLPWGNEQGAPAREKFPWGTMVADGLYIPLLVASDSRASYVIWPGGGFGGKEI